MADLALSLVCYSVYNHPNFFQSTSQWLPSALLFSVPTAEIFFQLLKAQRRTRSSANAVVPGTRTPVQKSSLRSRRPRIFRLFYDKNCSPTFKLSRDTRSIPQAQRKNDVPNVDEKKWRIPMCSFVVLMKVQQSFTVVNAVTHGMRTIRSFQVYFS